MTQGDSGSKVCEEQSQEKQRSQKSRTPQPLTTVMLRNLPNSYTRDLLLELLDQEGFECRYDFIYLPMDFQTLAGLGYAFVNFTSEEEATRAKDYFEGFSNWAVQSQKICKVSWSHPLQGLSQHLERYRNSPVMHEEVPDQYKPAFFRAGLRQIFPAPMKRLRPPRMKRGALGGTPDFSPTLA